MSCYILGWNSTAAYLGAVSDSAPLRIGTEETCNPHSPLGYTHEHWERAREWTCLDEGVASSFKILPSHILPCRRSISPLGPLANGRGKCTELKGSEPLLVWITITPFTARKFQWGTAWESLRTPGPCVVILSPANTQEQPLQTLSSCIQLHLLQAGAFRKLPLDRAMATKHK